MKGGFKPGKMKLDPKHNSRDLGHNPGSGVDAHNSPRAPIKSEFAKNSDRDLHLPGHLGRSMHGNAETGSIENSPKPRGNDSGGRSPGLSAHELGQADLAKGDHPESEKKMRIKNEKSQDVNNEYEPKIRAVSLMILQLFSSRKKNYKLFLTIRGLDNLLPYLYTLYLKPTCTLEEKEKIVSLFANLIYYKEIQEKLRSIINQLVCSVQHDFVENFDQETVLVSCLKLFLNMSINSKYHQLLTNDKILKKFKDLYFSVTTSTEIKELISILLANVSFTKETHEMLLLNDCIEIFEL